MARMSSSILLVLALTLTALSALPLVAADPPADGGGVVALYLTKTTLTPVAPTGTTPEKIAFTSTATTPAANLCACGPDFAYKFPHAATVLGDATVTIFLSSTNTAIWNNLQVEAKKGTTSLGTTSRGNYADSNGNGAGNTLTSTKTVRVDLAVAMRGTELKANDELHFTFTLWGVAKDGTQADAQLVYGAVAAPSRVTFSVSDAGALPVVGTETQLFMGNKVLTGDAPTADADSKRASESTYQGQTITTAGSSAEFSWGKKKLTEDLVFTEDSVLNIWYTWDGTAGAMRGLRAVLYGGSTNIAQNDIGVRTNSYPGTSGAIGINRNILNLPTAGKTIPAGTDIELRFLTWSATNDYSGKLVFLFGSKGRPAGLTLRTAGGAAAAAGPADIGLALEPSTVEVAPGASASVVATLSNGGTSAADVTLNATGDATVTFESDSTTIPASGNASSNITVSVASDAAPGTEIAVTIHAAVGGAEVANATLTIKVVAASTGGGPGSGSASPSAAPGGGNATASDNGTAKEAPAEKKSVPGPAHPSLVAVTVFAAIWLRRRREA